MSIGRMSIFLALAVVAGCGEPKAERTDKHQEPVAATQAALAKSPPPAAPEGYSAAALGSIHFEISGGTPEARQHFYAGLLALHSFWYDEALAQFQAAIDADKTFSMAYWGLAMSHAKLLWGQDDIAVARDILNSMPAPELLPPHDQAWVMAAVSLYRQAADVRGSRLAFLATMEQLHAKFPDDESATFLALALLSTLQPNTPEELPLRLRAGGLALEVFRRNPQHPGAAHYLIHAFDTPALALLALPAALQYAKIAPAAFHALHMPAHIFARLGLWKDGVASCQAAWDSSVAWVKRDKLAPDHQDFHSITWIIEMSFERGRRKDAERWMTTFADGVRGGLTHQMRAAYANQVTSFLARTGEWARVDELLAPLQAPASDAAAGGHEHEHGHADGHHDEPELPAGPPMELFEQRAVLGTRAQAAAMLQQQPVLTRILAERDAVDAKLHPFLVATQPKEFVDSADKLRPIVRAALVARARGDDRALIAALRPLAADQDQEFTGEGAAGGILHDEAIADALIRLGQAKEALAQYRLVLAAHPGRARSLLGAARAAAKAGDAAGSRDYYRMLLATWSEADEGTDGLAEARQAVAAAP